MENELVERDVYRTSRLMYMIEACVENFITILTTGAFLATLTKQLGISDGLTAILSSVTNLSALFQIITVFISHKTPVKRWVIPIQLSAHLMFCTLYLLPFMNVGRGVGAIFFILIAGAHALKSVISSPRISWFYSLVAPNKRGSFSSILTATSVMGMIPFSIIASFVFDGLVADGNTRGAFVMLTAVIAILTLLDIIPLFISKEKKREKPRQHSPFVSVRHLFSNGRYTTFLALMLLEGIALSTSFHFLTTYQINELGFSLSFISIIGTVVNIVWIVALLFFGRMSRKFASATFLRITAFLYLIAFTILVFTRPSNGAVTYTAFKIIYIIAGSARAISLHNIVFEVVEEEHRTNALAISGISIGVVSFGATLLATPLFNYLQLHMPIVFGVEVYAQEVMAAISVGLFILLNILWFINRKKFSSRHDI